MDFSTVICGGTPSAIRGITSGGIPEGSIGENSSGYSEGIPLRVIT